MRRVVVTGMGIISSIGNNTQEVLASLREAKSGISQSDEFAKHGFAWYLAQVAAYQVIYGALAALPIFLLWVYLCWIIILAGAAVSATVAEPGGRRGRRQTRATD